MEKQQYIDRAEHALYKVYNRFPVVFDRGEGVKLYDTDGQEYLDFGAGIAVMGLLFTSQDSIYSITLSALTQTDISLPQC